MAVAGSWAMSPNRPEVHSVQAAAPVTSAWVPALQVLQVVSAVAPVAALYLPLAQPVHPASRLPTVSLYVPAGHTCCVARTVPSPQ